LSCRHLAGEEYLPPDLMMESAARNGLGMEFDQFVLAQAIKLLHSDRHNRLRLSVSISHNSLVRGSFYYWLRSRLKPNNSKKTGTTAGLKNPQRLILQIREIDVLIAQHHMGQFCERMEELRVTLGISQYGASGEPGTYLSLLNALYVKLHVSLLERINENDERLKRLQKVVCELRQKRLQPIATDISDFSLLPLLWQAGIKILQGDCLATAGSKMNYQFVREEQIHIHSGERKLIGEEAPS
jgi:EAL domain-containing protein (putative c-di-GMP-specific phosphodiesterase class I)